jgi:propanediol utilization protein
MKKSAMSSISRGKSSERNRVGVVAIPIEISARHIHLSEKDFEKLFGKNEKLTSLKKLSQIGEFASDKTVELYNRNKKISNVRILGPFRKNSQVEISLTDAHFLKLNPLPKIKVSGDLADTTNILVRGKKSSIKITCIIAKRHLHISEKEAKQLKLKNNQKVSIKVEGIRSITFNEIIVRISEKYKLALHLDTDEGNSAGIFGKMKGKII